MDILKEIQKIDLPEGNFVVVGSAILQIKNIRAANDLDILVSQDTYDKFKRGGDWEVVERADRVGDRWEFIKKNNLQIYYRFYGAQEYNIKYYLDNASKTEIIEGIHFTSLKELIRSKSEWGREKDLKDIVLIEEYLKSH